MSTLSLSSRHFEVDNFEVGNLEVDLLEVSILEVDILEVDILEVDNKTYPHFDVVSVYSGYYSFKTRL
jgi:hypothetical protein